MINVSDQPTPRSLIVTLYGAYGRFASGPVPVAELIRLLAAVGVDAPSVRSSVSRLKRRGLLLPARTAQGAAGYALSAEARQLLDDGDRRIYATAPPADEGWVLAVFSVPESERQKRHVLRSRLAGLGFGTAAPGVWIAPARLHEETRHTLQRLRLDAYVDLFRGEHSVSRRPRRRSAAGGTWRRSPRSTRPSSADMRGCCDAWRHTVGHPAGGGLPRLSARPGRLAPPAVRGPGPAAGCCRRTGPGPVRRPSSWGCTNGCGTRRRLRSPG